MSVIRPELAARLRPWREVIAAVATGFFGVWLFRRGGLFFLPLGLAVAAVAGAWGLAARRRMRFARPIAAPGLVEIEEGVVRYFGAPLPGGEVPLRDLCEIGLLRLDRRPHWRLRTVDGEALLIPVEAAGSASLADGFEALPGFDLGRAAAALDGRATVTTVWRRP